MSDDKNEWWKKSKKPFAGRFDILESHHGGMSEVLICKDKYNSQLVAAKTSHFRSDLFSREARLWLGLGNHPNIVRAHTVIRCETFDSSYEQFLFMDFIGDEYGKSRNLRHGLLDAKDKWSFILKTAFSVLDALEHARNVFPNFVHRDLKPDNILVDDSGHIFVTDFGIGHIRDDTAFIPIPANSSKSHVNENTIFTATGCFLGTYGYAAPEQYFDSSTVSVNTDIYSLGIVLHELLIGSLPYNPHQIRQHSYQILSLPLSTPTNLTTQELRLWDIIIKMLSYYPEDRYMSIESVKLELSKLKPNIDHSQKINMDSKTDKESLYNRIYSFIELGRIELAEEMFLKYKKNYPFSSHNLQLTRNIFSKSDNLSSKLFLRRSILSDLTEPAQLTKSIGVLLTLFATIYLCMHGVSISKLIITVTLAIILLIENYLNNRTEITFDVLTLNGCAVGLILNLIIDQSIAGSFLNSIYGLIIGLVIPLSIAYLYTGLTKKEGVGGGTIKLSAMIGSWVGLLILPIITVTILILIMQFIIITILSKLPGDLKWSNNILTPRLYSKFSKLSVPTSTAITLATLVVILFTHRKV